MSSRLKPSELRERSSEDLGNQLKELKHELFNLRFQHHTNQLENHMRLNHVKKDIARIKTVLHEKEVSSS